MSRPQARLSPRVGVCLVIVAALAWSTPPTSAAPATGTAAAEGCGWSITRPHVGRDAVLYAVTAISAGDAWAVGDRKVDQFGIAPLAYHWDGASWISVPTQHPDNAYGIFDDVTALGPDDVWATGLRVDWGSGSYFTLAEHWDGRAWSIVDTPNTDEQGNELRSVTSVPGTNELWAVGFTTDATLIEHWDGWAWSVVSSPSPGGLPILASTSAAGQDDAWATGTSQNGPFAEHWDGRAWSMVPAPAKGGAIQALPDGTALSAGLDFERWDGAAWSPIGPRGAHAADLSAGFEHGWAVGSRGSDQAATPWSARWNGSTWTRVDMPPVPDEPVTWVSGVARIPGTLGAWAVGYTIHPNRKHRSVVRPVMFEHC